MDDSIKIFVLAEDVTHALCTTSCAVVNARQTVSLK
jgi:hypothetical protein